MKCNYININVKNTWKVSKCGPGYGWRRSGGL